jgi:hypothetical protein
MAPARNLPEAILSIYEEREKDGHALGPLDMEESKGLIIKLLKLYFHERATIVIDALDECKIDARRQLFHCLKHITASARNVKLFIASRNENDIQKMMNESLIALDHYIDAKDNEEDIETFIRSEVKRCFDDGCLRDYEKRDDIISSLEKGANGM